jgi:uncharacterized protein YkwD
VTKPRKIPEGVLLAVALGLLPACRKEPGTGYVAEAGPVERPPGPLTLADATAYVVRLVNHDRAALGLAAVEWDETAARAGQGHADDMAEHGYTAHWGTDGSVPEERYTAAGGAHYVQENAACFFDAKDRARDPAPTFTAVDLEKIEGAFMNEVPPNDGHKKNILTPSHRKLGVGLAKPTDVLQACMSQEFVDEYGDYAALPPRAHVGETIPVSGEIQAPAKFAAIGVARIDPRRPMPAAELNTTYTYPIPKPFILYSPPGYVTPKPVHIEGSHFSIDVPLSQDRKSGRYEVSVWATLPGDPKLLMVSLRVVDVK